MANSITISVIGDVKNLVSGTREAEGALGKLGRVAGGIGKTVAAGLAVGAAAFVAWGAASVKSLARIEQINTQTAQVIKSTGGAAGVTAAHVENLAGKLENLTATEAESTQEGANLLLTFTNVQNKVGKGNAIFDRATSTLVDMSRALGTEPKTAAIQLGKALNDPIKGVSALSRVGVSFTAQQKDQIKTLVESGKTMDAQKIILGELNKEFGGAGKAFAGTTQGKIALAGHAFGTLGETIFAKVLPPLGNLATLATKGLNFLSTSPAVAKFADLIGNKVSAGVTAAGGALRQLGDFVQTNVVPVVIDLAPKLAQLGDYFTQLGAKIAPVAGTQLRALVDLGKSIAQTFVTSVLPALVSFGSYVASKVGPILSALGPVVASLLHTFNGLRAFIVGQLVPAVIVIAQHLGKQLKPIADQLAATIKGSVVPAVAKIAAKFEEWRPAIQRVTLVVVKIIGKVLEFAAAVLAKVIPVVIKFAGFLLEHLVPAVLAGIGIVAKIITKVVEFAVQIGKGILKVGQFEAAVGKKIAAALSTIAGLPGKVVSAIGDLGRLLYDAGTKIIQGLIDGIGDKIGDLTGKLKDVTDLIPIHKGPPARDAVLLRPAGRLIIGGLIKGLEDGESGLSSYLNKLTKTISSAYAKTLPKKASKAELAAAKTRLAAATKAITAELKGLAGLSRQYAALAKARKDYAKSVRDSALAYADITGVGQVGDDGEQTTASIVQGLKDRLNAIKHFTAGIRALRKAHLNKDTIAQIVAQGVDAGTGTLDALLADPSQIATINKLEAAIRGASTSLGSTATDATMAQLDPAKVEKAARKAAKVIEQVLKNKLGIHVTVDTSGVRGRVDVAGSSSRRTAVDQGATSKAAAGRYPDKLTVVLTAEQLSRVQRGREITLDIRAYQRAGGK